MPYKDHNPAARGWQQDSTSRAATPDAQRAASVRAKVLDAIDQALFGLTSYEIAEALRMPYHTVQPRTAELKNAGQIERSSETRLNPATGKRSRVWLMVRNPADS